MGTSTHITAVTGSHSCNAIRYVPVFGVLEILTTTECSLLQRQVWVRLFFLSDSGFFNY